MTTNSLVPFRSFPCSLVGVKPRPDASLPTTRSRFFSSMPNALYEPRRISLIPAHSTTTGSTDNQHVDAQSEPSPAYWGAVSAGPDWSLSYSHQLQLLRLHKKRQAHSEQRSNTFHRGQTFLYGEAKMPYNTRRKNLRKKPKRWDSNH